MDMKDIEIKVVNKAKEADERLKLKDKYYTPYIYDNIVKILFGQEVEMGYRATCGKSLDKTLRNYREFYKVIQFARKRGIVIKEKSVKHDNAWATLAGGFWNSNIFTRETKI